MKPYPDQIKALQAALKHHRGIIQMPTGTGKTRVARMIIEALNLRTLIVVPTLEIKRQTQAALKGLRNVTIENIDSNALESSRQHDVLIIDECHHGASKTYQRLNKHVWDGIYYRFMLTATPFRSDSEETLLFEAICGQVIYKLSYRDAVKKGYIVPIDAYYIECPKQSTDSISYREVYDELVIHNETRNILLGVLMARISPTPTLCLVREIEHGEILARMTGFPFVSGQDEESRDYITLFNRGEIKCLIGTVGVLGEGIDTKPAEWIIVAGGGKAKSQFMQAVGRGLRRYPGKESAKIVLVRDDSHRYLNRHYNEQRKILLDEYQVKAAKIDL